MKVTKRVEDSIQLKDISCGQVFRFCRGLLREQPNIYMKVSKEPTDYIGNSRYVSISTGQSFMIDSEQEIILIHGAFVENYNES